MVNRVLNFIFFSILFLSCSSTGSDYKVLDRVYSKNRDIFIEVRKYGVNGGATVDYLYKFYLKDSNQSIEDCFIVTKGVIKYKIKWSSINTLEIILNSGDLELFKGAIYSKKMKYIVNKFSYSHF